MADPGDRRQTVTGTLNALPIALPIVGSLAEPHCDLPSAEEPQGLISAVVDMAAVIIYRRDDGTEDCPASLHAVRQRDGKIQEVDFIALAKHFFHRRLGSAHHSGPPEQPAVHDV